MRLPFAAATYFGLVFAAGFALGIVRGAWLSPLLGERRAVLLELPLMVVVSLLAARLVARRLSRPVLGRRIVVGASALLLMVTAELAVMHFLRHLTLGEYVATFDPIAGPAYLASLLLFGGAPALVGRAAARGAAEASGRE